MPPFDRSSRPHHHEVLLLGVDAGGTKTQAVVAEPGVGDRFCIRGVGVAGPGNPLSSGTDTAIREIESAIVRALDQAAADRPTIAAAVIAVAGAAREEVRRPLEAWAAKQGFAETIEIVADYAPVLACCPHLPDHQMQTPAIGVIAGTGSVAVARGADGKIYQRGGWGYLLGDEGSGYAIGRRAIRHLLELHEAAETLSPLGASVCAAIGASNPAELVRLLYNADDPRRTIASAARCVLQLARHSPAALEIIETESRELASVVKRAIDAAGLDSTPFTLSLAGGILNGSQLVQTTFLKALADLGRKPASTAVVPHPTDGCLLLAQRMSKQ